MENRINIQEIAPKAYQAMFGLEKYLLTTSLIESHKHLIKMRASQINGCAYCIDMHSKEAVKSGETTQRLFLLNAWKETNLFTKEEKILLAMTEEITLISHDGLSDATYAEALTVFDETYIASAIMAIVTINAWNRIAISCRFQVGA